MPNSGIEKLTYSKSNIESYKKGKSGLNEIPSFALDKFVDKENIYDIGSKIRKGRLKIKNNPKKINNE